MHLIVDTRSLETVLMIASSSYHASVRLHKRAGRPMTGTMVRYGSTNVEADQKMTPPATLGSQSDQSSRGGHLPSHKPTMASQIEIL